jgi:type I restriction enzyme R subunit
MKRILKKYGYPPDLSYAAFQTVLAQAEVLLRDVSASKQ